MMRKGFITAAALLALSGNVSVGQVRAIEEAEMLFNGGAYEAALKYFEEITAQNKRHDNLWTYRIAECYRELKDFEKAAATYASLIGQNDVPKEMYLHYGHTLRYLDRQEKALEMYLQYQQLDPGYPNLDTYIRSCRFAKEYPLANPDYEVKQTNLRIDGLHLGAASFGSSILYAASYPVKDEKTGIIYPHYRLVSAVYENGTFAQPQALNDKAETNFYMGSPSVSRDGKTIYFTQNDSEKRFSSKRRFAKNNISSTGVNTLNIYRMDLIDGAWSVPVALNINSREYSSTNPFISPDGKKLYFSSNRPSGKGGYDLYVSDWQGDAWAAPKNLGDAVNTPGDEMFPFVWQDSLLFFSSDGLPGFGGADIYRSVLRNGSWQGAENMLKDINSEKDDFGFFYRDDRNGFFASNRHTDPGKDELFSFAQVIHYRKGKGTITDELTLAKMPGVTVEVYEDGKLIDTLRTDRKGNYDFSFFNPDKDYTLIAKSKGYKDNEMELARDGDLSRLDFKMEPIVEKNTVFTFNDILFEYAKADLLGDSKIILDRLADLLIKNPGAMVELSAHTDSRGSDKTNNQLSQRRAESSVQYLISRNVRQEQLVAKGYGETLLKNVCKNKVDCTEEQHAVNRRVEIKVLDVK